MERFLNFTVSAEDEGRTVDWLLRSRLGLSVRQVRRAKFREYGIRVNGMRQRVTFLPHAGDEISVCLEDAASSSDHLVPCEAHITVLYEDEDILVVDKPSGVAVHPSPGHYGDSLENMLQYRAQKLGRKQKFRAVGRLDKDTSGAVVFALNQAAAGKLSGQRENGSFYKEYLALAEGVPKQKQGRITEPIGRQESHLYRMEVREDGKSAETFYEVLAEAETYFLLRLRLGTGRTHQIRVHMSWLGHPLLGDELYGGGTALMSRAALHAWKVYLRQPFTGEEICVEAPLPEDFRRYADCARINGNKR